MSHNGVSNQGYVNDQNAVVQMQPMAGGPPGSWMDKPEGIAGCPPGLEYLTHVDQLIVQQQIELLEVFTTWEQANKYKISNTFGQQVFFAAEESGLCMRQFCGTSRGFVLHITDNMGQEVIRVTRHFKCCAGYGCCACCEQCAFSVEIEAPVGTIAGYVRQECSCWKPHFTVRTADHETLGVIRGPCCQCSGPCCPDVEFNIYSANEEDTEIGKIAKKWTGMQELFTDADNFSVSFPMDLDVRAKASYIGALFLIDFMYFETKQENKDHY